MDVKTISENPVAPTVVESQHSEGFFPDVVAELLSATVNFGFCRVRNLDHHALTHALRAIGVTPGRFGE